MKKKREKKKKTADKSERWKQQRPAGSGLFVTMHKNNSLDLSIYLSFQSSSSDTTAKADVRQGCGAPDCCPVQLSNHRCRHVMGATCLPSVGIFHCAPIFMFRQNGSHRQATSVCTRMLLTKHSLYTMARLPFISEGNIPACGHAYVDTV